MHKPPYYAVIFRSVRTSVDEGYADMAMQMVAMAEQQAGFLSMESFSNEHGRRVTICYWENEEAILAWKNVAAHQLAQQLGKDQWYASFDLEICKVERAYSWER
jgi:heme-degrading monooxygenase HmoA